FHSAFVGKDLSELSSEVGAYELAFSKLKQKNTLNYLKIYGQGIFNLMDRSENPCHLIGEIYHEQMMIPLHIKANDRYALAALYVNKLHLCYLFGEYQEAVENAINAQQYLDGATSTLLIPLFHFYDSLAHLAIYSSVSNSQDLNSQDSNSQDFTSKQEQILARVTANQEKMQKWADSAPTNYLHKFYIVEAEKHRVQNSHVNAMDFYDRAIAAAEKHEYINEEALANELAGKFYLDWGKEKIAKTYINEAYYLYSLWGATAKVGDLETKYAHLLVKSSASTSDDNSLRSLPTKAE
ncbi:MAG: hypothetical protein AAFX80_04550, partial [Cyanobacteria bacterium J06639_18]